MVFFIPEIGTEFTIVNDWTYDFSKHRKAGKKATFKAGTKFRITALCTKKTGWNYITLFIIDKETQKRYFEGRGYERWKGERAAFDVAFKEINFLEVKWDISTIKSYDKPLEILVARQNMEQANVG